MCNLFLLSQTVYTSQYSVTKHQKVISGGLFGEQGLPGIFLTYELSPIMVRYTEIQRFVVLHRLNCMLKLCLDGVIVLLLDEAVASRAVFVIISELDGRSETLLEPAK